MTTRPPTRPPIRIVLIHGNAGASVEGIWFPYLKRELERLGHQVVARTFPDPIKGRMRYWLPYLTEEIRPDERTVIVGHSSGALAALRYAETAPLLGTFAVAGHHTDCGFELERRSGFFDRPWDWEAIRRNQRFIVQFHSKDDPWVPVDVAEELHRLTGSDFTLMDGMGHFGSYEQQMDTFPELLAAVRRELAAHGGADDGQ
ncbi:RBBP9/YdeN family alpha/beta hydrolase [Kitasatospora sp. NPDC101183]|uniref:RBBP9/YdeN family alpha/beta hydrolase n=1 Tax=Kitasatospora sp. NPDC101183 TaxID=3364100 RepID=UPI003805A028